MDYLDATNMLSVWKSGGRHNWNNAEFDKLVKDGGAITDDPAARTKTMKEAERLLVEDAPGVFVYHQLVGQLQKPYRKGRGRTPNTYGLHRRPVARRRNADANLRHAVPGRRCHDDAEGVTP